MPLWKLYRSELSNVVIDDTVSCSEDELKDVLLESIRELPEGGLKSALCDNFEEHFDKLKGYVRHS